MFRNITITIVGTLLLVPACIAIAGETGMSYDDTVNPGAPPPRIAPPGGGNTPKQLTTNTTPITPLGGGTQPQAVTLPREVQPGEETPQTDDNTTSSGGLRPPRGVMLQPGGGDGTQTEDELYVGRKVGGGSVSSGDEDEFEDLDIERRTVQGASTPGVPSKDSLQGLQPGGGDGTQTEDELYVGRKAGGGSVSSGDEDDIDDLEIERQTVRGVDTPGTSTGGTGNPPPREVQPGDATPASTGNIGGIPTDVSSIRRRKTTGPDSTLPAQEPVAMPAPAPSIKPAATRPPPTQRNYGTVWTGLIDDPNANVNPCQKGLERGEQLQVKTYKTGDTTRYDVNYQCYLLVPAPRSAIANAIPQKKCGTSWTGWIDDPDADVNPCSKGCEPGEQQIVDAGIDGGVKKYNVRYQCYVADTTLPPQ